MLKHFPIFLERFFIEYFVNDRKTDNTISSLIVLSFIPIEKDLHVSKFHPELYLEIN